MKRTVFLIFALAAAGGTGCKARQDGASATKDDSADAADGSDGSDASDADAPGVDPSTSLADALCQIPDLQSMGSDPSASDQDRQALQSLLGYCQASPRPALPDQGSASLTAPLLPAVLYVSPPNLASCDRTAVKFTGAADDADGGASSGALIDAPASCQFYLNLEANQWCSNPDNPNAGMRQYPLLYGFKYCERFASLYNALMSNGAACPGDPAHLFKGANTLRWVASTMECLQDQLNVACSTVSSDHSLCPQIWDTAFASHPLCYTNALQAVDGASICHLCPDHVVRVLLTVDSRDLFSRDSLNQVVKTTNQCGLHYVARLWLGLGATL